MKQILYCIVFLFILTSCSSKQEEEPTNLILDEVNEAIDFSKVKAFDIDKAKESIDEELNRAYVPRLDNMYDASRAFNYNIQHERSSISSVYDLDEQSDEYSTTVEATYRPAEERSFKEKIETYFFHLLKSISDKSRRIKYKGFTGYNALYGAKLDERRFQVEKDGYVYDFTPIQRRPVGYREDFDFVTFTIDSLNKADEYKEWEEIEKNFIPRVHFPNSSDYRPIRVEFTYCYDNDYTKELLFSFDNDDTWFQFGAYEESVSFDPDSLLLFMNNRNVSREVINFDLTKEVTVDRHIYHNFFDFKQVVYMWKWDGLHYYLSVTDERVEDFDMFKQYEDEYIDVIKSMDYGGLGVSNNDQESSDGETKKVDESSPYYALIESYRQAVEEEWDQDRLDQELNYRMGPESYLSSSLPENYGYLLMDINGDGRQELIFGEVDHGSIYDIDEIFILDEDEQVVKIFESAFLRRAEISTDGIIRVSEEIHSASGEEMTDYYDLSELMTDEYIVYPTRNLKELRDVDEEKLIIYNIEKLNAVHLKDDE